MTSSGTFSFNPSTGQCVPSLSLAEAYYQQYPSEPLCIVYQAVNAENGKRYIGMTSKGLRSRVKGHKSQATAHRSKISRAVLKYGIEAFQFSILAKCSDRESALLREKELIAALKPEYNIRSGGDGPPPDIKHSEEVKRARSERMKGGVGFWRGKTRSPESIAKMVATRTKNGVKPWLGKKMPREMVEKRLATIKLLPIPIQRPSPEVLAQRHDNMRIANERRMNPVYCTTDGKAFRNPAEAARYYGVSKSALRRWVDGVSICQRGLRFEYVE